MVQWVSFCVGGFLAEMLRTKWTGVHGHEELFPDTTRVERWMLRRLSARRRQPNAEQRVDSVVDHINDASLKAGQAADFDRKRAAQLSTGTALVMLIGAFIATPR